MLKQLSRMLTATVCVSLWVVHANAQSPVHNFISLVQGKEVPIPADYVGNYEEQKKELLVTLDSLGMDRSQDEAVTVVLVRADGTTESQKPNANGDFVFSEITSGLASLVVTGTNGTTAVMAVFVDSLASIAATGPVVPTPAEPGELPPAARSGVFRIPTINNVDKTEISRAVSVSGFAPQGAAVKTLSFYKPSPASRFQVRLINGVLQGKIVVPEDGFDQSPGQFNVSILKSGSIVGTAVSDADGNFHVGLASTGVHSIIAAGPAGYAAFSFEVIDRGSTAGLNLHAQAKLVAKLPEPGETLYVLVVPPRLMPAVRQIIAQAYHVPVTGTEVDGGPFAPGFPGGFASGGFGGAAGYGGGNGLSFGGGVGGGFGGGGGGLGGPGGIGALLGIGGLAAGIAALANDDSDNFNSPVASRIVP